MKNDVATAEKTEVNTKAELLAIGEAYKSYVPTYCRLERENYW